MALIICKECGGKLSDKATVCPHCGAPVELSVKKTCPECGAQVDAESTKCPECGCPLEAASVSVIQEAQTVQEPQAVQEEATPSPTEEPKKSSTFKWVLLILIALAVLVGVYTHCFSKHDKDTVTDDTDSIQVEQTDNDTPAGDTDVAVKFHTKGDVMKVIETKSIDTPAGDVTVNSDGDISSDGDKIGNINIDEISPDKAKVTLKINSPLGDFDVHVQLTPDGILTTE